MDDTWADAGQRHRIRVTQDQRAFVTDSVSHAAPLASEIYFRGTDTNLGVLNSAAGCLLSVDGEKTREGVVLLCSVVLW